MKCMNIDVVRTTAANGVEIGAVMIWADGSPQLTTVITLPTYEAARWAAYGFFSGIQDCGGAAALYGFQTQVIRCGE